MALLSYGAIFGLALSIVMIVVGSTYSDCRLGILLWMRASGGVAIGMGLLSIITNYCQCSSDDDEGYTCRSFINATIATTGLSMSIWGSVVVFGNYDYAFWYCNPTFYTVVFAILLVYWSILGLFCICLLGRGCPSVSYQEI